MAQQNPFAVAATLEENKQEGEGQQAAVEEEDDPVWLGDLIRDGFYDKLVLIGFPYDEGARKAGNRRGADFGPGKFTDKNITQFIFPLDSFRRFVKDIGSVRNPEYGINIATGIPKIADYGNIQIESQLEQQVDENGQVTSQKLIKATISELYAKLGTKVGLCLQRDYIPVVIGGSRDLFQAIVDAY